MMRVRFQRIGGFMAAMVVPNIAAFIAWGFATALFIPGGWLPNPSLARITAPMLVNLLPILIGFAGGRLMYGVRGGVVGAVATMGAIVGADVPMFIGAMAMGPFGGWAIRRIDRALERRIPIGFEMLTANFSAGLVALTLALVAVVTVGPLVGLAMNSLAEGAASLAERRLLPLLAAVIEPAKVTFMNNAINHGVLAPLGVTQVKDAGRSIFFLLETNPGPGLGLLLAYWIAGSGEARHAAPGAIVIHFFGGIHELYFPYVLMNPTTIVAVAAGGFAADLTFVMTGAGLVATPSPGSIVAEMAMAPKGGVGPVLLGIAVGTAVSLLFALPLVRRAARVQGDAAFDEARARLGTLKGAGKAGDLGATARRRSIVFACEAGMGSSVIGRTILQRKLTAAGLAVDVSHASVTELPDGVSVVVSHTTLVDRVREVAPQARLYAVEDFIDSPVYDQLVDEMRAHAGST
jgi:mannitol PTS system EIICBA or EIICB component